MFAQQTCREKKKKNSNATALPYQNELVRGGPAGVDVYALTNESALMNNEVQPMGVGARAARALAWGARSLPPPSHGRGLPSRCLGVSFGRSASQRLLRDGGRAGAGLVLLLPETG